jgi:hypothetical protein
MTPTQLLVLACATLALHTLTVGIRMFYMRVTEMRSNKISPQKVALSVAHATQLNDSRASDNYNHLFELPILFYVLCVLAIATQHIPTWLPYVACLFVISRIIHSVIQCTYNKVMHRFTVFLIGFLLIAVMWLGFLISFITT